MEIETKDGFVEYWHDDSLVAINLEEGERRDKVVLFDLFTEEQYNLSSLNEARELLEKRKLPDAEVMWRTKIQDTNDAIWTRHRVAQAQLFIIDHIEAAALAIETVGEALRFTLENLKLFGVMCDQLERDRFGEIVRESLPGVGDKYVQDKWAEWRGGPIGYMISRNPSEQGLMLLEEVLEMMRKELA